MRATAADYRVLCSEPFDINSDPASTAAVAETLTFKLSGVPVLQTQSQKPILSFNYLAKSQTGQFGVWVNTPNAAFVTQMQSVRPAWTSQPGHELSVWKAIPGELLDPNDDNFVRFGFAAGQNAKVLILDAVLWFHTHL